MNELAQEIYNDIKWLLKQRRIWVALLSIASFTCTYFGIGYGAGITAIVAGALGVHSLIRPKK